MMGKIIGTTLAGITQFTIWIILGGVLLFALVSFLGIDTTSGQVPLGNMAATDLDKIELIILDILKLPLITLAIFLLSTL